MLCIGLTGTIASGKSTVAQIFKQLDVDVIDADHISRELTLVGQPAFDTIATHFGPCALTHNGELNRRYIRQVIFTQPQEKIWLENYLHPLIRKTIEQRTNLCKTPYCIIEIPLLIDRKKYPFIQRMILVIANRETRMQRLMKRDNHSREEALLILNAQCNEDQYKNIADDILVNNGIIDILAHDVARLHLQYLG